jgi:hypothetical protein
MGNQDSYRVKLIGDDVVIGEFKKLASPWVRSRDRRAIVAIISAALYSGELAFKLYTWVATKQRKQNRSSDLDEDN